MDERKRHAVAEWAVTVLLLLFGTTTLAQAFVIPTGSMENNLLVGDHLLVDKLAYSPAGSLVRHILPYQEPKHGDIIVFRYPPDPTQMLVKRLIGTPGDHIRIAAGVLYRNGRALQEPYVVHKYGTGYRDEEFPGPCCRPAKEPQAVEFQAAMLRDQVTAGELVVPPGSYFAMGDNRDNSSDSRYWGFVPRDNIVGKPFLIYWSYDATTDELTGDTAGSLLTHFVDVGQHFFTRTRWNRTLNTVRSAEAETR